MKPELPDNTSIIAIIFTIIVVFTLAFSVGRNPAYNNPEIQWRDQIDSPNSEYIQMN